MPESPRLTTPSRPPRRSPGSCGRSWTPSGSSSSEQLHDLGVEGEAGIVDDNFADTAQVSAEQGEQQALAAQLRDQLDDVERALARLDDGTYGTCEICGQPIGEARLEVMPATRFCIEHAG